MFNSSFTSIVSRTLDSIENNRENNVPVRSGFNVNYQQQVTCVSFYVAPIHAHTSLHPLTTEIFYIYIYLTKDLRTADRLYRSRPQADQPRFGFIRRRERAERESAALSERAISSGL